MLAICAKSGFFDVFINYLEREGTLELPFVGSTELFRVLKQRQTVRNCKKIQLK